MTLTIGRVDPFTVGPYNIQHRGDRLRFDVDIHADTFAEAQAVRAQLLGHADNDDEPVIPITHPRCGASPLSLQGDSDRPHTHGTLWWWADFVRYRAAWTWATGAGGTMKGLPLWGSLRRRHPHRHITIIGDDQ